MEEIDKLRAAYQQITASRKKKVSFKLPKLLHLSMQDVVTEGGASNLSGYYIDLVGFDFYCLYKNYFDELLEGQKPNRRSLILDELPKASLSQHDLQKVLNHKYYEVQLNLRSCPAILVDVCNYLQIRLNSYESRNLFFRRLTLPLAIHALQDRINLKIADLERGEPLETRPVSRQLSLSKWWKQE